MTSAYDVFLLIALFGSVTEAARMQHTEAVVAALGGPKSQCCFCKDNSVAWSASGSCSYCKVQGTSISQKRPPSSGCGADSKRNARKGAALAAYCTEQCRNGRPEEQTQ